MQVPDDLFEQLSQRRRRGALRLCRRLLSSCMFCMGCCVAQAAQAPTPLEVLGAKLFFDARLSADGRVSCASCHVPELAFADARPVARGTSGAYGQRNTPSLVNVGTVEELFWDGRRASLEDQALDPLLTPHEHGLLSVEALVRIVSSDSGYRQAYADVFGDERVAATKAISLALAAFERTLTAEESPFDRWLSGDANALPPAALRGLALFTGHAGCASCHSMDGPRPRFTDSRYWSMGVGMSEVLAVPAELLSRAATEPPPPRGVPAPLAPGLAPMGRFVVSHDVRDIGAYRTPTLRNVANTGPYMHDGSAATLEEAVDHEVYYQGRQRQQGGVTQGAAPLVLTRDERGDVVAFLRTLTSDGLEALARRVRSWAEEARLRWP